MLPYSSCVDRFGVGVSYGRFFRIAFTSVECAAVFDRFPYIALRERFARFGLNVRSITLPVAVSRTRLAVPLWVFIFGTRESPRGRAD